MTITEVSVITSISFYDVSDIYSTTLLGHSEFENFSEIVK